MKLLLNIRYRTSWGQCLSAVLTWHYSDGSRPPQFLPMSSDDGQLWTLTVEPATSRSRRLEGCTYYYIVTDNRGTELRRESADRHYRLAADHSYVMNDCWLEDSEPTALAAVQTAPVSGRQVPLFQRTLLFMVEAPALKPGEAVGLLGSHPALGAWHTGSYLRMEQVEGSLWQLSVDAYQLTLPIEYKYVVVKSKSGDFVRWEDGYNRTTGSQPLTDGDVLVLRGEALRMPEPPMARLQQLVNWAQEQGLRVVLMPNGSVKAPAAEPRTFIFDLDGTLLDTLQDLMLATNHALQANGLPVHSIDEIRQMVGNGVRCLIERAVPAGTDKALTDRVYADFARHYMLHSEDNTRPYPGIDDMLERLSARGCRLAVVSNKMHQATEQLVSHFFGRWIKVAVGEDEQHGIRRKPAPDMVNEALRRLDTDGAQAVYVGDSEVDVLTAQNSGLKCVSVLWGFRTRQRLTQSGATCFVETPSDLENLTI